MYYFDEQPPLNILNGDGGVVEDYLPKPLIKRKLYCPICEQPAHIEELDIYGRCLKCQLAECYDWDE